MEATLVTDEKLAALVAARDSLRNQSADLAMRRKKLEQQQQELAKQHGGESARGCDKLKLNVGGVRVVVRRETLTQFKGTRLAALFSGRWENKLLRDRKGRIFLDVNPVMFKKIVDYHNLYRIAPPDDPPMLPTVPPESQETFNRLLHFFGLGTKSTLDNIDSKIINCCEYLHAVEDWLDETLGERLNTVAQFRLLYRATRDGWQAAHFHNKCDRQGATVTVVKSSAGWVFGGYLDQPWTSNGGYGSSSASFLFSLRNPNGTRPTKAPLLGARSDNAYHAGGNCGPTFGTGYDLHISSNANVNGNSSSSLGSTYKIPPGQNAYFFTGEGYFRASEVEVFAVDMRTAPRCKRRRTSFPRMLSTEGSAVAIAAGSQDSQEPQFQHLAGEVANALEAEHRSLSVQIDEQEDLERLFEEERVFVDFFAAGETNDIVDLDVSGEKMSVKRSTLMLCSDSALAKKFDDTTWAQSEPRDDKDDQSDEEGFLIEHSSYCFGKIVDHLRLRAIATDEDLPPPPHVASDEQDNFERVVKYYFPGVEEFILGSGVRIPSSQILDRDSALALGAFLSLIHRKATLLYRATRDGWQAAHFHNKCDRQGATVTVVKSSAGWVFGGYLDQPWTSNGGYGSSSASFLFSLRNPNGTRPTKAPLLGARSDNAYHAGGNCGPTFGTGYDLHISSNANVNGNSSSSLGSTYKIPPGQNAHFFTGTQTFQASEVEVYHLS